MEEDRLEARSRAPEAGSTWAERAQLDPLGAVLDPGDVRGGKNRLIDRAHKYALSRALGDVHGLKALDFGCGTGRLSEWLVRNGADVDGVDTTAEMIAVAAAAVPVARFQIVDGSKLPFPDGDFDLVVTAGVLQYYVDSDLPIVRELARVLRRRGRLIAIEQVADGEPGRGGPVSAYRAMFTRAGLQYLTDSFVRTSDSRYLGVAQAYPNLADLPWLPRLVVREARKRAELPLTDGRYADALFQAMKAS